MKKTISLPIQRPLTFQLIAKQIQNSVCKVNGITIGSGFFIGPKLLITALHCVGRYNPTVDKVELPSTITIVFEGIEYTAKPVFRDLNHVYSAVRGDYCLLQIDADCEHDSLPVGTGEEIELGAEVYFGGYPLQEIDATIHRGTISAVGDGTFSIDGTVVGGHSGGPVCAKNADGRLVLIGILKSQAISVSPEYLELFRKVELLKLAGAKDTFSVSSILTFTDSQTNQSFSERITLGNFETLYHTLVTVRSNISTGIGKAINIKFAYRDLTGASPEFDRPSVDATNYLSELPVGRKKRANKAHQSVEQNATQIRKARLSTGSSTTPFAPPVLYRYVSKVDAKQIKKNGIVHTGSDLDEIPFITKPNAAMAKTIGAVCLERLVVVYTDLIPGLTENNVDIQRQRNAVLAYKLNISIPPEALEILEN